MKRKSKRKRNNFGPFHRRDIILRALIVNYLVQKSMRCRCSVRIYENSYFYCIFGFSAELSARQPSNAAGYGLPTIHASDREARRSKQSRNMLIRITNFRSPFRAPARLFSRRPRASRTADCNGVHKFRSIPLAVSLSSVRLPAARFSGCVIRNSESD